MPIIHVLDSDTIDKIAAGEVVERPSSVVKELVENAIDAGADSITVEARDGGISMVRVTDNGCGMDREQVRNAFLRHATSKIESAQDLNHIMSLGFRGEALSSIAAVSQVEIITKTANSLTGTRLQIDGGQEKSFDEVGAPDGTTFVMRNLFYNTPVRKKFLKHAPTEGGYITDLMEHLALSRPDISFKLVLGNQTRFHTSGNGDLKEVIYRIYGREMAAAVIPIQAQERGMKIEGYLGKPILVRSNRSFEIYYMNGRFIRSSVVAKAIEEGYKEYLMQHKFPFCVLHLTMDPERVDVNVHPTKMDVRFSDSFLVSEFLSRTIRQTLRNREMIPEDKLENQKQVLLKEKQEREAVYKEKVPEAFEINRTREAALQESTVYHKDIPEKESFERSPVWERIKNVKAVEPVSSNKPKPPVIFEPKQQTNAEAQEDTEEFFTETDETEDTTQKDIRVDTVTAAAEEEKPDTVSVPYQMNLFQEKILVQENRDRYRIIGQVFDTYWMFQFEEKLCILDQHAAHEKVKYERFMKHFREKDVLSQSLMPPIIVSLSGQEEVVLKECMEIFHNLGFEIEAFGGSEYALRSVPLDLYGCSEREMFLEVLDELETGISRQSPQVVEEKIASMACKAAVKGNNKLSYEEADALINELLTLDNPYNCPHGRPTIITISKYEMEKKFKRIL